MKKAAALLLLSAVLLCSCARGGEGESITEKETAGEPILCYTHRADTLEELEEDIKSPDRSGALQMLDGVTFYFVPEKTPDCLGGFYVFAREVYLALNYGFAKGFETEMEQASYVWQRQDGPEQYYENWVSENAYKYKALEKDGSTFYCRENYTGGPRKLTSYTFMYLYDGQFFEANLPAAGSPEELLEYLPMKKVTP